MADYIDRQAAIDALEKDWNGMVVDVFNIIRELPSVDAVDVVRCKNCIYYEARQKKQPWKSSRKYCNRQVILCTEPNDFCSFAERKTDGSDK